MQNVRKTSKIQRWTRESTSPRQTQQLAENLGRLLGPGDVVALVGELGSGKTIFSQGLARGLQVPESFYITSPSFAIVNEYPGRIPFYHLDLYRLGGAAEIAELGLEEILYGRGAVAIEWAERLQGDLPVERLEVHLAFSGETRRVLAFHACGVSWQKRVAELIEGFGE